MAHAGDSAPAADLLEVLGGDKVGEEKPENGPAPVEPTLIERWLEDQQEWQKTAMAYLDAMVKNDEFLVHLGNAMRGSLLAGKPYPGTPPAPAEGDQSSADGRIDEILFALHQIQGQLQDLRLTLEEIQTGKGQSRKDHKTRKPKSGSKNKKQSKNRAAEQGSAG